MTQRLYYAEPYLTDFTARVVERLKWEQQPAVVLDRTAFYPTGGGQPHDTGALDGVSVVDVIERETDGAVLHVLDEPLEGDEVKGHVHWPRRFDLMQQHTGQHILSAAFVERLEANTVGFHLSDEYATIDIAQAPLSAADLRDVEARANALIFENRSVHAAFVSDADVPSLSLRKPLAHQGPVRIVDIPDFDSSACGGTHVRATGEVGLIKITRSERRGTETRIEFLCGGRALADYEAKNALVMALAQEFTVGYWELTDTVHRLVDELKDTRRELRRTRDALLDAEASVLWNEAEVLELGSGATTSRVHIVRAHFFERSLDDLKHLVQRLVVHQATVALLATEAPAGQTSYFTFARSDDLEIDMGRLVREACEAIGGRGGGRPGFAQGGGPGGEHVAPALEAAHRFVRESLQRQPS